jgi:hypothetical protein
VFVKETPVFHLSRRWNPIMAAALMLAAPLAGCGADEERAADGRSSTTSTQTATTATTATTAPTQTIVDAREAVDADRYAQALTIAAALTAAEANSIRKRISNRYARRVRGALRSGNRARASFLLRQAGRYPRTQQLTQARLSYRAAQERIAERARQRRVAAGQRAAARERERQQQQQEEDAAPSAPSVPSGTCSETPMTDFPVPLGDPRDRDGDGIACES